MASKAVSASRKVARKTPGATERARRSIADDVKQQREAAQAAGFARLVNGFEARIRDIDHTLNSVLKQLAG